MLFPEICKRFPKRSKPLGLKPESHAIDSCCTGAATELPSSSKGVHLAALVICSQGLLGLQIPSKAVAEINTMLFFRIL